MTTKEVRTVIGRNSMDLEYLINEFLSTRDAPGWRLVCVTNQLIPGSDRSTGSLVAWMEFVL